MKKILAITISLLLALPTFAMAEEIVYDDIFNNPILTIVATMKDEPSQPSADAVLIEKTEFSRYNSETDDYTFYMVYYYSDGSFREETLFTQKNYLAHRATRYFPAYLEDTKGFYLCYENTDESENNPNMEDIYLVDTNGAEQTRKLVGSVETLFNPDTSDIVYNLYTAEEKDGEKVRTKITESPVSYEEKDAIITGSEYIDGLKFGSLPADEYGYMNGFTDINGKVYFADPVATYYNYFYNLGYLVESSNNGYALDYSLEDPESTRVYTSVITNVFTNESCGFYDTNIRTIFDSGYALVDVKNAARKETTYIAKVKSAIITVFVDDEKVLFDVLPTIRDGRTLVPLRAIFEALNAQVSWDGETQTITATKGDKTIVLKIGSDKMTVNGEEKVLDVPASITDGRTLVPARAISEALGCTVSWDDASRSVNIVK